MEIELIVGDWSKDGHNQTETFIINSSHPSDDIDTAYRKSIETTSFNFDALCSDYEDNILYTMNAEDLQKHGIPAKVFEDLDGDGYDKYYLDTDTYIELFLEFVKLSLPDFKWEIITNQEVICIGGYGLFSM